MIVPHFDIGTISAWANLGQAMLALAAAIAFRKRLLLWWRGIKEAYQERKNMERRNKSLKKENTKLKSDNLFIAKSRDDYKSFLEDVEERLEHLSRGFTDLTNHASALEQELIRTKNEVNRFKELAASQKEIIDAVASDLHVVFGWGRNLSYELSMKGMTPNPEPQLSEITKRNI